MGDITVHTRRTSARKWLVPTVGCLGVQGDKRVVSEVASLLVE